MTIDETLRDQDGLITRDQAREGGSSDAQIAHRLRNGAWRRVRPEVFLSAEHTLTDRAEVRADMLWLGENATLIGLGAAWWWRIRDDPPPRRRWAIPCGRRVRGRGGTGTVRRAVAEHERVLLDGVRITTRAVTILDVVAELGVAAGSELADRELVGGRVTVDQLRAAHRPGEGRRGGAAVERVLALAAGGARFEAERTVHRLLCRAGIGGWVPDHPVDLPGYGGAFLDLAFPDHRVVIEIDGWAYHRDLPEFRRDRRRQNALVLAGWTVLRVTWHDLVETPDRVLAEIWCALGR